MKAALTYGGVAFFAACMLSSGVSTLRDMQCHARWANSGFKASYSISTGCRVQKPNGHWIPESAVRETGVLT